MKVWPFLPTRVCLKKAGPRSEIRMSRATTSHSGVRMMTPTVARTMSITRLDARSSAERRAAEGTTNVGMYRLALELVKVVISRAPPG